MPLQKKKKKTKTKTTKKERRHEILELSLRIGRKVFFVARLKGRSIFGRGSILGFVLGLLCLDSSVLGLGSILGFGSIFGFSSILGLWRSLDFLSLALVLGLLNPLALVTNLVGLL